MAGKGSKYWSKGGAIYGDDERLRYTLWRDLHPGLLDSQDRGRILFVMLNPSTATEYKDDPTIRRCVIFAHAWGFRHLTICNLFAHRATNPDDLVLEVKQFGVERAIGKDNDRHIVEQAEKADVVVAAWGAHVKNKPALRKTHRDSHVASMLAKSCDVMCLEKTKVNRDPKHPLYVKSDCVLQLYREKTA